MQVHLTSPLTGEALRLETPEPRGARVFSPDDVVTWIVPAKLYVLLTGAERIHTRHPLYEIVYSDGTAEGARVESMPQDATFMDMVSAIQTAARRP